VSKVNVEFGGLERRAILEMVRQMLGPMYDPEKEDQYVRAIRMVREYAPIPEPILPVSPRPPVSMESLAIRSEVMGLGCLNWADRYMSPLVKPIEPE